jgi:hypothetical protein
MAVETDVLEQRCRRLRRVLGNRLDLDPGQCPLQPRHGHSGVADFYDGVGADDEIRPHFVEHVEHRKYFSVLSDPCGQALRVQDDGLEVRGHATSVRPAESAAPKILARAPDSSSSVKAP